MNGVQLVNYSNWLNNFNIPNSNVNNINNNQMEKLSSNEQPSTMNNYMSHFYKQLAASPYISSNSSAYCSMTSSHPCSNLTTPDKLPNNNNGLNSSNTIGYDSNNNNNNNDNNNNNVNISNKYYYDKNNNHNHNFNHDNVFEVNTIVNKQLNPNNLLSNQIDRISDELCCSDWLKSEVNLISQSTQNQNNFTNTNGNGSANINNTIGAGLDQDSLLSYLQYRRPHAIQENSINNVNSTIPVYSNRSTGAWSNISNSNNNHNNIITNNNHNNNNNTSNNINNNNNNNINNDNINNTYNNCSNISVGTPNTSNIVAITNNNKIKSIINNNISNTSNNNDNNNNNYNNTNDGYYKESDNSYENIVKNFGKVELNALAYRLSASCKVSKPRPSQISSSNLDVYLSTYCYTEPILYKLDSCLIGPNSLFLNQFTGHQLIRNKFLDIPKYRERLSNKVFLGGVPISNRNQIHANIEQELLQALSIFGRCHIIWPKGIIVNNNSASSSQVTTANEDFRRGHCYAIFDDSRSVMLLLAFCQRRQKGNYINLCTLCPNLSEAKFNSIQVIPWDRQDSYFESTSDLAKYSNSSLSSAGYNVTDNVNPGIKSNTNDTNGHHHHPNNGNNSKEYLVFVGALHGLVTARALFNICNDMFGNVEYCMLDTDKAHYPIGSGRVKFSTKESYLHAVTANFVLVVCQFFSKVIQIDPYLEDALCSKCSTISGIYFCRNLKCFSYFCPPCWIKYHDTDMSHKPLRRTLNAKSMRYANSRKSNYNTSHC